MIDGTSSFPKVWIICARVVSLPSMTRSKMLPLAAGVKTPNARGEVSFFVILSVYII
jgi:hypothetical protein